jgi:hypothetical protein
MSAIAMTAPTYDRQTVLTWLVPGIFVVIACAQVVAATAGHLTPWKGGGFGMFASLDGPGNRYLAIHAQGDDRVKYFVRIVAQSPQLDPALDARVRSRLIAYPTASGLLAVATAVKNARLRVVPPSELRLPLSVRLSSYGPMLESALAGTPVLEVIDGRPAPSQRPVLTSVSVRIVRLLFDGHAVRFEDMGLLATTDHPGF